jgi:hypothetical protein
MGDCEAHVLCFDARAGRQGLNLGGRLARSPPVQPPSRNDKDFNVRCLAVRQTLAGMPNETVDSERRSPSSWRLCNRNSIGWAKRLIQQASHLHSTWSIMID